MQDWTEAHPKWQVEDSHLVRYVRTTDYPSGVRLLEAQVALAEGLDSIIDNDFGEFVR